MTSLLVTNDFPPKLGGIQSYLHELWRRLPPDDTHVLATPHDGADRFDTEQEFHVERVRDPVLLPRPGMASRIDRMAGDVGADVVFLDPTLPLGLVGRRLSAAPHVVVVHGAEVTVPGRLPVTHSLAGRVLRGASGIVAAGNYPAAEAAHAAGRPVDGVVVPPGVDASRFRPLETAEERARVRRMLGLDPDRPLVLGLSRLVPRKGFDVLLRAVARIPGVQVAIGGTGRDRRRLERIAAEVGLGERAAFLGRIADDDLSDVYACADVFAMLCRERWRGLEAEGFGIVFLEAAACGVPVIAGRSGGSHEAVVDGETGYVVDPEDVDGTRELVERLLGDDAQRERMGKRARQLAETDWSYDERVKDLVPVANGDLDVLKPLG
ncbi:MAG: glycosyltransferase family 4 protein [Acidimicrobiia bacterium]